VGRRRITDLGRGGDKQFEKQAICLGVRSVKTVKDLNKKRTTNRDPGAMGAIQVRLLPGLQGGALQGPGVRLGPSAFPYGSGAWKSLGSRWGKPASLPF
jgi:hypothetical protein